MNTKDLILVFLFFSNFIYSQTGINKNISFSYKVFNDLFISNSCDYLENGKINCKTDSVKLYMPIKHAWGNKIDYIDTMCTVEVSYILGQLNEPKFYNSNKTITNYRFVWFKEEKPIYYRILKQNDIYKVLRIITDGNFSINAGKIIKQDSVNISTSKFEKIANNLNDVDFWTNEPSNIVAPDILVEVQINDKYKNWLVSSIDFVNGQHKQTKKYKKVIDCFEYLDKLFK